MTSCVLLGSALAACSSAPHAATARSDTPAATQARWFIGASADLPLSAAALHAHFAATFLAPGQAAINKSLATAGQLKLVSHRVTEASALCAGLAPTATQVQAPASAASPVTPGTASQSPAPPAPAPAPVPAQVPARQCYTATVSTAVGPRQLTVAVSRAGLIDGLRLSLVIPQAPTTWQGVDAAVTSVAPKVALSVAKVTNGSCQPVHSIDPGTPAPLASVFRLYVLDALARAVAAGKVSWTQQLTVTARLKSLGAGALANDPDGTRISVLDAATEMISTSDNTAADLLINLLGRTAVEAALGKAGMTDPGLDMPFPTARELIALKLVRWPALARRYIAASRAGQRALLASVVDRAPLPSAAALAAWTTPRDINSIESFGSASDICRVYLSLDTLARRSGLSPVPSMLGNNDTQLELDPAQWRAVQFMDGSEPGVLTLAAMATTPAGQSYVVTILASNPTAPLDEAAALPAMLSAARGAFTLAARG